MRQPWYKEYFSPAFWRLAELEYTQERTERELRYLREVLKEVLSRRGTLLDLGCGRGRHAIPLARDGAMVTGMDVSAQVLGEARAEAEKCGVPARWVLGDALLDEAWPEEQFDAIVCIQSFGWGSDADQRRLLLNCRRHLAPNGILVLDHSNVYQIVRNFVPSASTEHAGIAYEFERTFNVLTERSIGRLTARLTDSSACPVSTPAALRAYDLASGGVDISPSSESRTPPAYTLNGSPDRLSNDTSVHPSQVSLGQGLHQRSVHGVKDSPAQSVHDSPAPGDWVTLPHDIRLYATNTLLQELRHASFEVKCIDADFEAGRAVTVDSRYVQIISTPAPRVPESLVIHTHKGAWSSQRREHLNLMWAPDEADWLKPTPRELWRGVLESEYSDIVECARDYRLDDPYGARRSQAILAEFFNTPLLEETITFGAGATSLFGQLGGLASGGRIIAPAWTYADFGLWATACGAELLRVQGSAAVNADELTERLLHTVTSLKPAVLHVDRPTIFGQIVSLDAIAELAMALRSYGGYLLIDEAYHAYYAGSNSAASLVPAQPNVVVLRSLSKAYCCGGLRVGFAIAGRHAAVRVRELVSPLQVSELAFKLGLELLKAGDIFKTLRERIRANKARVLAALPIADDRITTGAPDLPWVVLHDSHSDMRSALDDCGILVKPLEALPLHAAEHSEFLRLSVPLSDARMGAFEARIAALAAVLPH